jgi:hypothetical protein
MDLNLSLRDDHDRSTPLSGMQKKWLSLGNISHARKKEKKNMVGPRWYNLEFGIIIPDYNTSNFLMCDVYIYYF